MQISNLIVNEDGKRIEHRDMDTTNKELIH